MTYSYRIEQAIRAAALLHDGQVRRGAAALPYITHLFAVAAIISDYTDDEDVFIAGLLHDTIEDTDYTFIELEEDFGAVVRDLVAAVSEPQENETAPLSWKEKKDAYIKQLRKAPQEALVVSAADKIHNMRSVIEEYYGRPAQFVDDFGGTLEERIHTYQELSNIFNRNLKNDIIHEFNHVFDEYKKFIEHAKKEEKQRTFA